MVNLRSQTLQISTQEEAMKPSESNIAARGGGHVYKRRRHRVSNTTGGDKEALNLQGDLPPASVEAAPTQLESDSHSKTALLCQKRTKECTMKTRKLKCWYKELSASGVQHCQRCVCCTLSQRVADLEARLRIIEAQLADRG